MNSSLGDFEVDLSAEFLNIRLKLSKLMSIQPGSLLEIGDLLDTSIFLVSQDKIIGMGELVIADNKLAITIKDVFLKNPYLKEDSRQLRIDPNAITGQSDDPLQPGTAGDDPSGSSDDFAISSNSSDF